MKTVEEKIEKKGLCLGLSLSSSEKRLLEYRKNNLKRCTKCILPETMLSITFDSDGACNYCSNIVATTVQGQYR